VSETLKAMTETVSASEVAGLLRKIITGAVEIAHTNPRQLWKDAFAGDIEFIAAGYRLVFFNDCAELDYVDHVIAPDGRKGTFGDWHAQGETPLGLLGKSERAALEEKLEEAR
jgi:hypothetical protein